MSVDRSRLPAARPNPPFALPAIEKSTLPNGLRVWTVAQRALPMVTVVLLVRCGSADDPPGGDGLAAFTADMLDEGSGDRSAIQMHEGLADLGTELDADIGSDALTFGVEVLSRFTGPALGVLADMIVRPAMRANDFERVRQLRRHRLVQLRDLPRAVAERAFLQILYGGHPYGHLSIGSSAALEAATLDQVRAFHRDRIRPGAAILIAVGDCTHAEMRAHAVDAFGAWRDPDDVPAPVAAADDLPGGPRLAVVDRPGAPQSELRIGQVAARRITPDYHALLTANTVLGGQFVSRVNLLLREEKGFTYGAYTWFDFRRRRGPFSLTTSVDTPSTAAAVEASLGEIAAIRGSRPITAGELELAVAALTLGWARNFETPSQIARAVSQIALYDLPDDDYSTFVPRVEAVTADAATDAFVRHVDPARLSVLVVGDRARIDAGLARLDLGEPVIIHPETFW